jgi:NADH dehydrogenase
VHIFNLIGFRNRLLVLVDWAWDYFFGEKGVRLIVPSKGFAGKGIAAAEQPGQAAPRTPEPEKPAEERGRVAVFPTRR